MSTDNRPGDSWNSGLMESRYWCEEMFAAAPAALGRAYRMLYEAVREGRRATATLLIRDVYMLTVRIPVTILLNGLHELCRQSGNFRKILDGNLRVQKLFQYSFRINTEGSWWKCIECASKIDNSFFLENFSLSEADIYIKTRDYIRCLKEELSFSMPWGENGSVRKVTVPDWRQLRIGHGCVLQYESRPFPEVPDILEMFSYNAKECGLEYYKQIRLIDKRGKELHGWNLTVPLTDVYVKYCSQSGEVTCLDLHRFIAGMGDRSLAFFEGYNGKKAYLFSYASSRKYYDQQLTEYLSEHNLFHDRNLSAGNVDAYNLSSKDIQDLENYLADDEPIIAVTPMYRWLMDAAAGAEGEKNKGGILLLTGGSGAGKTAWCRSIDPLDALNMQAGGLNEGHVKGLGRELLERWRSFEESAVIREYHFRSDFRSKKEFYLPEIQKTLMTIKPAYRDGRTPHPAEKIIMGLPWEWNSLASCDKEDRKNIFAQLLNDTLKEHEERTDKYRLLLILDGVDEAADMEELLSFIPDGESLAPNVYVLLVSRLQQELADSPDLVNYLNRTSFAARMDLGPDDIRDAAEEYAKNILTEQGERPDHETVSALAEAFDYRFVGLSAYRRLSKMSPVFHIKKGKIRFSGESNLLSLFVKEMEQRAPESYLSRIKDLLTTLAWAGEALTLRELAFLSGQQFVSFQLIGSLEDLKAFLFVSRSEKGNRYELSHAQWIDAVRELYPSGGVEFRMRCNELLDSLENLSRHNRTADIFLPEYEGERWLLTHILKIYNRDYREMKENWFEYERMDVIRHFMDVFLSAELPYSAEKVLLKLNLTDIADDYLKAMELFGKSTAADRTGVKINKLFDSETFVDKIAQLCEKAAKEFNISAECRMQIIKAVGIWDRMYLIYPYESTKKYLCRSKAEELCRSLWPAIQDSANFGERVYVLGHLCIYSLQNNNIAEADRWLALMSEEIEANQEYSFSGQYSVAKLYLANAYVSRGERLCNHAGHDNKGAYREAMDDARRADKIIEEIQVQMEGASLYTLKSSCKLLLSKCSWALENTEQSIQYLVDSLKALNKSLHIQEDRDTYHMLGENLYFLSWVYNRTEQYQKALDAAKRAYVILSECSAPTDYRLDLIKDIIALSLRLKKKDDLQHFLAVYQKERKVVREYEQMYAETYGMLMSLGKDSEYCRKLPESLIRLLERLQNPYMEVKKYKISPEEFEKRLANNQLNGILSEKTVEFLKQLARDYWENPKKAERAMRIEEYRNQQKCGQLWGFLREEMDQCAFCYDLNRTDQSEAANEVEIILQAFLPRRLVSSLPLEMLLDIRKRKSAAETNTSNIRKLEFLEDTIPMLKAYCMKYELT